MGRHDNSRQTVDSDPEGMVWVDSLISRRRYELCLSADLNAESMLVGSTAQYKQRRLCFHTAVTESVLTCVDWSAAPSLVVTIERSA